MSAPAKGAPIGQSKRKLAWPRRIQTIEIMILVVCRTILLVEFLPSLISPFTAATMRKWAGRRGPTREVRSEPVGGTEIEVVLP